MIVRFSVENWLSFKEKTEFSMIATRERQHGKRLPKIKKYSTRLLPIAAIFGGNASGKSNFYNALEFAKEFVVDGSKPEANIPVSPFRLDKSTLNAPSRFEFEILVDEIIYDFSFSVTREKVVKEKLIRITSSSEKVLYERNENKIDINTDLENNDFLKFASQAIRENQLFLTTSVELNAKQSKPVYDWFKRELILIDPNSKPHSIMKHIDKSKAFNEILKGLDTGIDSLSGEEVSFDTIEIPESVKSLVKKNLTKNRTATVSVNNNLAYISLKNGELIAKKLVTYHRMSDGSKTKFSLDEESDGTLRVIDLIPAFISAASNNNNTVYVIDELDRSLHTLLTRQLIEAYLDSCTHNSRSQLLFTTHDVLLMDQNLLRRDEMWVTERKSEGDTSLYSFSEFGMRYDKVLRKNYLQGRLGGIPRVFLNTFLASDKAESKDS